MTTGLGEPDDESHPVVHHAYRRSFDIDTVWRMLYELPPNDPRYLEMEEDQMIFDLLTTYYRRMATRREIDPGREMIADLSSDSKKVEELVEATRASLDTPETRRKLQAVIDKNRKERQEPLEPPPLKLGMSGGAKTIVKGRRRA